MKRKTVADEFIKIARGPFAPVYPVIAEQIFKKTGFKEGKLVDAGCGPGGLGISYAKISNMDITLLDISKKMLNYAMEDVNRNNLADRVKTINSDVHSIPLDTETINLVISRGSMFFWENRVECFKEIYRILISGGIAYIGGGFGSNELKERINKTNGFKTEKFIGPGKEKIYENELITAEIKNYEIIRDDTGMWIIFRKV